METNLIRLIFGRLIDALKRKRTVEPTPEPDSPGERRKDRFTVHVDGILLRGQVFYPSARPAMLYPAVIICHGIPGSGTSRPPNDPGYEALAETIASLGIAAVIFNFRGCGDSGGNFHMMGWTRDLESVLDKVVNIPHIDPTRVILLGFSGGGAAAIRVAAEDSRVYALAAVGTPAHFRIFKREPDEIIDDFRQRGIIRDANYPPDVPAWIKAFDDIEPRKWAAYFKGKHLLIIHGDKDELVPLKHAFEIFNHVPAGVGKIVTIPDGVHRLRLDPRCVDEIRKWLLEVLGWKAHEKP